MELLKTTNHEQLCALLSGDNDSTDGISETEVQHLAWLGSQVPDGGEIVEIGSHRGKSICCIASGVLAAGHTARIFCVDLWTQGEGRTFDHYSSEETWRIFNQQIFACGVADMITPVQSASVKAAAKRRRAVDLLFIDASHKYPHVKADFEAWQGFVGRGGRIAFHDYGTRFSGVDRVVNEQVIASGDWAHHTIAGRIWSGERA